MWREVLTRPQVTAEDDFFDLMASGDDFFDLGGHSLAAIRMAARVSELAGRQVTVQDVFDHPTLGELAAFARPAPGGCGPDRTPARQGDGHSA